VSKVFGFTNSNIIEINDLKMRLQNDLNYRNHVLKMLNTILGIQVDYRLLIKFLDNHIQKERLRKV